MGKKIVNNYIVNGTTISVDRELHFKLNKLARLFSLTMEYNAPLGLDFSTSDDPMARTIYRLALQSYAYLKHHKL